MSDNIMCVIYCNTRTADLSDYKIYSFNGIPKVILVCKNRFSEDGMTEDYFDVSWKHLDVRREEYGNSITIIPKPKQLDEMLELAKRLSTGIPFLRTDFYIIDDKIYFGELTFFPASGLKKFIPESFDKQMGEWINLESLRIHNTRDV